MGIDKNDLTEIKGIFPKLTNELKKGDCGRIGVIGGSTQYTGAPYFSSITGADLSYLFSHPDAARIIKSYEPNLMVNPTLTFSEIELTLSHLNAIVFGPGLGRDVDTLVPLLKDLINLISKTANLCLDGLFILSHCLINLKGLKNQIILTPNYYEFERLYNQVFPKNNDALNNVIERVKYLSKELEVCIIRKGKEDIITDGDIVQIGQTSGSLRRCGGQGDILSGVIALFSYWNKLQNNKNDAYKSCNLINGAKLASDFVRLAASETFSRHGRSMTASDIISEIPNIIRNYIDKF